MLQRRGSYRREYPGTTLRANLGIELPRPVTEGHRAPRTIAPRNGVAV
ncbi:hypothetical protein [Pseudonocardia oroxyli]|uniref:Uncharacterized protein n=1 Tax=Pseudonocardia oroxyli TaxID=366584 RepID=A0A1G8CBE4_PSEOR|nr:hypothetical protein [Pseudonocardia oroxyli]SDH42764.1 hypothetical protein SAMN05216377_12250 [Pseudonocardia oroxyli]